MTLKSRIEKLEKVAKPVKPRPTYQIVGENGKTLICYSDGKSFLADQPLPKVKTYSGGCSPEDWPCKTVKVGIDWDRI